MTRLVLLRSVYDLMELAIYLVASSAYYVDEKTRIDLFNNIIINERDYVSNLTKGIRDFWVRTGIPAYSFSRSLNQSEENIFGCDGLILLKYISGVKVCLFEAKYPRFSSPNYRWDVVNNNISHFTHQLHRQRTWSSQCAIWELFINEYKPQSQPVSLDSFGSTCISHYHTDLYDRAYRISSTAWKTTDIYSLLNSFKAKYHNIRYMLQRAAQCYDGKINHLNKGMIELVSDDKEYSIIIPADLAIIEETIPSFMKQNHLAEFLYLDFTEYKV